VLYNTFLTRNHTMASLCENFTSPCTSQLCSAADRKFAFLVLLFGSPPMYPLVYFYLIDQCYPGSLVTLILYFTVIQSDCISENLCRMACVCVSIYIYVCGLSKKKPNFFLKHLLISLQLKTCLLQSTTLHCLYTASVFSSSGTRFAG
jgi:hypothetical protein